MTQEAAELLKKPLTLSLEERVELANPLFESLEAAEEDPAAVEAAWTDEKGRI